MAALDNNNNNSYCKAQNLVCRDYSKRALMHERKHTCMHTHTHTHTQAPPTHTHTGTHTHKHTDCTKLNLPTLERWLWVMPWVFHRPGLHLCGAHLRGMDQQPGFDLGRISHALRLLCSCHGSLRRRHDTLESHPRVLLRVCLAVVLHLTQVGVYVPCMITCMPGESCRWFRSLLLCSCNMSSSNRVCLPLVLHLTRVEFMCLL